MASRLNAIRSKAVALRKQGKSYRDIHTLLAIPLSTLNYWLRNVELTEKQKTKLDQRWRQALVSARQKAAIWHNAQKAARLENAKGQAMKTYEKISKNDCLALEIALAFLYLGEGSKKNDTLGLGNSDPKVIKFYIRALKILYGLPYDSLHVGLHLRADQDENERKTFWSRETGIPLSRFKYVSKDKRTIGRPTYADYNGVCLVTGGGVEIQRRLMYLAEVVCAET